MPTSVPEVEAEVDVGERLRELRRFRRATLRTIADRLTAGASGLSSRICRAQRCHQARVSSSRASRSTGSGR